MNARHRRLRAAVALALALSLLVSFVAPAPPARAQDAVQPAGDPAVAVAGDEAWDNRFGLPGVDSYVYSLAVAADGRIWVGGEFGEAGNSAANYVAAWDGRQFHPLGAGLSGRPAQLVTDGTTLYAVGDFQSAGVDNIHGIARWDGSQWSAVGSGVGATSGSGGSASLYAAAIYNGRLVIGGDFDFVDGVAASNIAFWNGSQWKPLGAGIHGPQEWSTAEVRALLAADGKLYVGGTFEQAGSVTANSLAVWNGSTWAGVGGGVRIVANGNNDLGEVRALAYGGATLYAGGYFNRAGGKTVNYIAQFSGGAWSALGAGVKLPDYSSSSPIAALLYRDNTLYIGGSFPAAGGQNIDMLAAWDGATWSEVAGGLAADDADAVYALAAAPAGLVIGGDFRLAGDKMVNNVALLAGSEWAALGQGVSTDWGDNPGEPYALAGDDAGRIYVGGEFTRLGGVAAKNIGMWDGARWWGLGDADDKVLTLAVGGGTLYAGGAFTEIGGVAAAHVAAMNLQNGQWSALGSGINGPVNALVYSDGVLYAGGAFKAAGSVTAEDVAWWDGGAWHAFEGDYRIFEVGDKLTEVGTYVNALAVVGDDVYIGGHFQTIQYGTNTADLASYVVVHNVVAWNAASGVWSYVGPSAQPGVTTDGGSGFGTDVFALALTGSSLFVGGDFNQAGSLAATGGLARWDRAAEQWVSVEGSLGGSGFDDVHVRGLAPSGADLLVAGKFTSAGAAPARYIARFDTTTDGWSNLGSGLRWYNDSFTRANAVLALPGGVYVGGAFDQAGASPSLGLARWTGALGAPNLTPEQGGTVQAPGVQVTFPPGAVSEACALSVTRTAQPTAALPGGLAAVYGLQVAVTTLNGQQLRQAAQPYTVQASYTGEELAARGIADQGTLQLLAWDGAAWQPISTGVDTQNQVVSASTTQLGALALTGQGAGGGFNLFLPAVRK